MKLAIAFILLVSAGTAYGEKLIYHSPRPQFELEHTGKVLRLQSPSRNLKIEITKCNQPLVDAFWAGAKAEYEKYPTVRGTPKTAFADLDGKRRLIVPGALKNRLRRLPEEFVSLLTMDRQKCKN